MRWIIILCLTLTAPALAQQKPGTGASATTGRVTQDETDPFRDPGRTLPYLAYTLGQLHYLAFACESDDTQEWRNRMIELLELEAPLSGNRRERLIDAFNDGYRIEERARIRCGADAEAERRDLARRGAQMSQALLNGVLD